MTENDWKEMKYIFYQHGRGDINSILIAIFLSILYINKHLFQFSFRYIYSTSIFSY